MRIYLTDQSKNFSRHLQLLKRQPVMEYDPATLAEKTSVIALETTKEIEELDLDVLFNYRIFPGNIMASLTQWSFEKREMQVGDTIVQQVFIPPVRRFSQKIVFGVRVNELINEPARIGFSYQTLNGHVEKGVSSFTIEKTGDQKTVFKVHTHSRPGTLLAQLAGPVFSIPYQTFCTRHALRHVKQQLENIV